MCVWLVGWAHRIQYTLKTAVTLSCLYQVASDDALCRSPFSKLRKPEEKQAQRKEAVGAKP